MSHEVLKGKKVRIETLGCRSNLYESEAIASALEAYGAVIVKESLFDVAIINSCTVTQEADRKSRQLIRKLKRFSPAARIVVCGCWAQKSTEDEAKALGIDALVGNRMKSRIPEILINLLDESEEKRLIVERRSLQYCEKWDDLLLAKPHFHTRVFVKVQDGCSRSCSYCIIPSVRGRAVSRPLESAVKEVKTLVANGCKEVVLTGIQLGFYGKDIGSTLADLVESLSDINGLERIRFGSIEPFGIDRDLVYRLASISKLCPHFHLPLQSGDDRVLEAMSRGYASLDFARVISWFREAFGDDVHIGTDIIVGFPGETDEMFKNTLSLVESLAFGRIHVFPYSARKGTRAYALKSDLTKERIHERVKEAILLRDRLLDRYARRWIGKNVSVLVEESTCCIVEGLTPHFLRVKANGSAMQNEVVKVFVNSAEDGNLYGIIL
ncbi:MAG: tRNA (N(6)-L-threonylcarbamoyladenosine(37)-C(2))-methylthiotransferase MtaB [Thermovirga sp.]|nr:tRNA (N(6)-L-threonylcarbamoyladenosine(37)-C(2))-methylthiotransferase MtaB [Thermovirga sp.]